MQKIQLLPGMAAAYPVYAKLKELVEISEVPFLDPEPNERLVDYSRRMATRFDADSFIGGISFGGIVAQEVARLLRPRGCIVIASVREADELPLRLRIWRPLGQQRIERLLGSLAAGAGVVGRMVRSRFALRLTRTLSSEWHRWATASVIGWRPTSRLDVPTLHLQGDSDATFPLRNVRPDVVIPGGKHALPVSNPAEVAAAIAQFVEQHSACT